MADQTMSNNPTKITDLDGRTVTARTHELIENVYGEPSGVVATEVNGVFSSLSPVVRLRRSSASAAFVLLTVANSRTKSADETARRRGD
jgi:hypothetical protein